MDNDVDAIVLACLGTLVDWSGGVEAVAYELARINGDDLDDLQDSDPVSSEAYSPQQEYDDAVEEAEYLEQYTGSDYEVTVEHGVITVDPVATTGAGPTPSAGLG